MGLDEWVSGFLPTRRESFFSGNFVEDILRKILSGIGWREDKCTFSGYARGSYGVWWSEECRSLKIYGSKSFGAF